MKNLKIPLDQLYKAARDVAEQGDPNAHKYGEKLKKDLSGPEWLERDRREQIEKEIMYESNKMSNV